MLKYTHSTESRDEILEHIKSTYQLPRKAAKTLPITLLHGGSFRDWVYNVKGDGFMAASFDAKPTEFIQGLEDECRHLMSTFANTELGKKLVKLAVTKVGKDHFKEGRKWAFSTHMHTLEDMCLRSMQRTALDAGWPIHTLMFDGGHLPKLPGKTEEDVDALLRKMEEECKATTGYDIKLTRKEFEVPPTHSLQTNRRKTESEEDLRFDFEKTLDEQAAGDKRSADSDGEGGAKKRRRLDREKPPHDPEGESDLWGETDSFSTFKVIKSRSKANISKEDAMEVDV